MTAILRATVSVILVLLLPFAAVAAGEKSGDEAVLAAYRAFLARDGVVIAGQIEKTRNHVLAAYVRYWAISLRLKDVEPEEINDFFDKYAGTVLAERLRQEWLHELGKQGRWEQFRLQFPLLPRADSENKCYALQESLQRQGINDRLTADFKGFWNAPRSLPEGCLPVAAALVNAGRLSAPDIEARLRRLLMENLVSAARRTRELAFADDLPGAKQIEEAFRYPASFLAQDEAILKTAKGAELAFFALLSLARSDLPGAATLLEDKLKTILSLQDQQRLWAYLATRGARRHLPESLEWFKKGEKEALAGEQLVWRTRIALRQENWPEVKSAIEGMTASLRNESAWTYWMGRSLGMTGNNEAGRDLFKKISGRYDFYGLLAAEELGIPLPMPPQAAESTREELSQVAGRPALQRALALYRLNLRTEAAREWRWGLRSLRDRQLLAAAELARINGVWDRSANTAELTSSEHNFALRYPTPYKDILIKNARNCNLEEAVVLGLARQESLFAAEARSPAGAMGLMQLMPETARITARKIGMAGFNNAMLTRPEVNIELGTSYLRGIMKRFSANYAFAAAAYNAGPRRAEKWRNAKPLEGAIYVESIPFTETRLYVKKVLANAVYYSLLYGLKPLALKQMLGTIGGSAESEASSPNQGEQGYDY
ncbi:MAG: lytic transglycosylase domain-containing protein [Syntrophales bacterium]|jgi:soluble lytic murein transglycosylase|nr:lytic transglycosylase domain-containing protein [Syntrophales bacterium]